MADIRETAFRYAAEGIPVFLLTNSKKPVKNCRECKDLDLAQHDPEACDHLLCHSFYAATIDPQRLDDMFDAAPSPMLAIRTGRLSNTVVVDVDPDKGGEESLAGLIERDLTPRTALVRTGSGGLHLYYRHPGTHVPISQGRLGPGIDVRGDGGYAVAPPSIHPRTRRPYRWLGELDPVEMPPALVAACMPSPEPIATPRPQTSGRSTAEFTRPDRLLDVLLGKVLDAKGTGKTRATLYGSSRGVARMVAAGAISASDAVAALTDTALAAGQTARDARAAIRGGFRDEGVIA